MVVIDIYGKIEKTKISDKLKLYISNVPEDWKIGIIEDMLQEIRQQKVDLEDNLRRYGKAYQDEYNLLYLTKIVQSNIKDYTEYKLDTIENCIECLADNMVCLYFDYDYEDMPFFDWTSNCFDGRLCEEDYAEKVLYFSNFVNHIVKNGFHMNCIYSSNMNPREHTRILLNLSFKVRTQNNSDENGGNYVLKLKDMGTRIDSILQSENDFYKLDYLMNGIYNDNSYNQNHFIKTFSLLELMLLKSNQKTAEIDDLLIPFLKNKYGNDSKNVVILLRQMRNKIGHGDFQGFNKTAEVFAQKFMKDFGFDYSEYSRLNWVISHTCCLLDDLLRSVLFQSLKNSKNCETVNSL